MRITLPQTKVYFPGPGICIYCRDPKTVGHLSREHIIPFGLGGQLVLHKASCTACAKIINQQIETPCQQHMLLAARTHLQLNRPKRRPKKLRVGKWNGEPGTFPQDMGDAEFRWEELDVEDHPFHISLPRFPPPGVLWGEAPSEKIILRGLQFRSEGRAHARQPGEEAGEFVRFSPAVFCRFVAKIAHGAAIAELGLDAFDPMLPNVILGRDHFISYVVGNAFGRTPPTPRMFEIALTLKGGFLIAIVRLFSNFGFRHYEAVVGIPRLALTRWHLSSLSKFSTHVA